ncbi:hypothetical protein ACQP3J_32160, partial [Escherichia coli]
HGFNGLFQLSQFCPKMVEQGSDFPYIIYKVLDQHVPLFTTLKILKIMLLYDPCSLEIQTMTPV